jgi:tetratricopeptide (TPR) repeat protein
MFIRRIRSIILAILWLWPASLHAQSEALMEAYNQGQALYAAGQYEEAIPLFRRALELGEREFGPDHPTTAVLINNLAFLYKHQGRYAEAEPLLKRVLAIDEKALGPDHPDVAGSLNNLAFLYHNQGRYEAAEPLYKRALAIDEEALGPDHPNVALSLNNLAELYRVQGRYEAAEPLKKRALAIYEEALGPDHPDVAMSLNNLALLYYNQGRYWAAEPLYKRALAIYEKALGPDHPDVAQSLNNLALLYYDQGLYAKAEPLHKRALAIKEKALGPAHPDVAQSLNNLASLYDNQGRYEAAEPLFKRALAIREKALGPDHPDVATSLASLALLYSAQGRYEAVEPLHKRALEIWEKALGPAHPDVAMSLNNLAALYQQQGRYEAAEPLYKRSLAIQEDALGPEHPDVAQSLNNLALLYSTQGRYEAAEPLNKRALAIREKALGPDHPNVALSLNNLASLYRAQGRYDAALDHIRRATAIHRARAERTGATRVAGALKEQASKRYVFLRHVSIIKIIIEREPKRRSELLVEAFEVGQLAQASNTAGAVARMSARFATGDDALAETVRAYQDAVKQWQRLDARLVKAVSEPPDKRDATAEVGVRSELKALDGRIGDLDARLAREFPEYAALASPKPLSLSETQSLLGPGEALITYAVWDESTFLWVVRHDDAAFHRLDIGREDLEFAVAFIRAGLDQRGVGSLGDIQRFDVDEAVSLYQQIFAPAEPMLEGVLHVFVVPDGALQSLPLGVLVTEMPEGPVRRMADYRNVSWLAKKYAMTVLPSVSSLRALRHFARATLAKQPFVGFGDPELDGMANRDRSIDVAALFTRGAVADVDAVRELPRLPDTADELIALATTQGADDTAVYLQARATEAQARSMDLSDYRILAFATHGLVAGELKGVVEPALVLTPPEEGSEADDGLLTASEIATLKLDADWVILSACNTAAADGTPGAEGLSGMAKAFFYAGARALLVSHWSVNSEAAVAITTGMLGGMADNPEIGRAEALRRSMLAMMETEGKDHFAHPMFWAPFVVVGEGGRSM